MGGGRASPKPLQRKDLGRFPIVRNLVIFSELMHEHRNQQQYQNMCHFEKPPKKIPHEP